MTPTQSTVPLSISMENAMIIGPPLIHDKSIHNQAVAWKLQRQGEQLLTLVQLPAKSKRQNFDYYISHHPHLAISESTPDDFGPGRNVQQQIFAVSKQPVILKLERRGHRTLFKTYNNLVFTAATPIPNRPDQTSIQGILLSNFGCLFGCFHPTMPDILLDFGACYNSSRENGSGLMATCLGGNIVPRSFAESIEAYIGLTCNEDTGTMDRADLYEMRASGIHTAPPHDMWKFLALASKRAVQPVVPCDALILLQWDEHQENWQKWTSSPYFVPVARKPMSLAGRTTCKDLPDILSGYIPLEAVTAHHADSSQTPGYAPVFVDRSPAARPFYVRVHPCLVWQDGFRLDHTLRPYTP